MATALSTLVERCSWRFDDTSHGFIDAGAEWPALINEALAALHNELVSAGEGYLQTETTLTLVDGQVQYTLPADFFKLVGAFLVDSGEYVPLQRFMTKTFRGGVAGQPSSVWGPALRYDVRGSSTGPKMWFDPTPDGSSPDTIAVWYVPTFVPLVLFTDELPAWLPPGWEEFIVNYAVTRARVKEQSASAEDVQMLLEAMQERVRKEAVNRDLMNPQRVVSVGDFDGWPY